MLTRPDRAIGNLLAAMTRQLSPVGSGGGFGNCFLDHKSHTIWWYRLAWVGSVGTNIKCLVFPDFGN